MSQGLDDEKQTLKTIDGDMRTLDLFFFFLYFLSCVILFKILLMHFILFLAALDFCCHEGFLWLRSEGFSLWWLLLL